MEGDRHNFLLFWTIFCPFFAQFLSYEKMKKTPKDIIILRMCIINNSHMMYGSRDMECNGQNFFVILDCFLFLPTNNLKNQNFDKMKNRSGDIIILHMCIINDDHMICGSWNMKRNRQNFLSSWTNFCSFIPLTT